MRLFKVAYHHPFFGRGMHKFVVGKIKANMVQLFSLHVEEDDIPFL
jgi:hypothetical protein